MQPLSDQFIIYCTVAENFFQNFLVETKFKYQSFSLPLEKTKAWHEQVPRVNQTNTPLPNSGSLPTQLLPSSPPTHSHQKLLRLRGNTN